MWKNRKASICFLAVLCCFGIFFTGPVQGEDNPFEATARFDGKWFTATIPSSWESTPGRSGEMIFLTAPDGLVRTDDITNVVLGMSAAQTAAEGTDAAQAVSNAMDALLSENQGTEVISRKAMTWQGSPAERLTLAGSNSYTGESEVSEILAVVSSGTLSIFALTVPKTVYETGEKAILGIIGSIRIMGLGSAAPADIKQMGAAELSEYISSDKIYALHKPASWTVADEAGSDAYRVKVLSPDKSSLVDFYWARNASGNPDAGAALALYGEILRKTFPETVIDKAWVTSDRTRAAANVTLRGTGGKLKGRYYVEATGTGISVQGYAASEKLLPTRRPVLLNIMSSMALLKVLHQGESATPFTATFVMRQAQDGSLTVSLPEDWQYLAAQGKIVAGAPGGGMGFIFTAFAGNPMLPGASLAQGVIGSQYLTPDQTIPVLLEGFGHSNPEVTSSEQDTATIAAGQATLGRNCDAADLSATWISSGGVPCMGIFKVLNTLPAVMGQWSSVVMGIWGPQAEFARYVPILEQVASSYAINDAFARSYIQSGLANLRRLQQKTAAAMQSLNDARADNQAAWEARQERKDYMDSKWDDYRRGQGYWVSDIEGGKVYQTDASGLTDTANGDYYEGSGFSYTQFNGQNPQHPSEDMQEIGSYELEHGGKPQ